MHTRLNAGDIVYFEQTLLAERDHRIEDRMQNDAARIRLVAVAGNLPAPAESVEHQLGLRNIAVDASEAALAFNDLLRGVEALLGQERRQQSARGCAAGVERLAHGAAVLLHAGRLGRGDAERMGRLLCVEAEQ